MSPSFKIKRLRTIYLLYWFLLTYIIAALIWWFIALSHQNNMMTEYKLNELSASPHEDLQKEKRIIKESHRKTVQYIGEGLTFFLLIVIGAILVFRAVRRQFKQSQQQQHFMMAITHELKTPIAITKLNLETLQKHKLSQDQQLRLISSTIQEANRLNTLCNNLLMASRIDSGNSELTPEKINLTELVKECIHDFIMRYPKRDIKQEIGADIFFVGDLLMLQMAINNLLDNAVKYSSKEDKIEIILKKENPQIILLVKDEGNGIPDEEKLKIFNKFYRVGNTHTKEAKGTGLGLYLTKKIVQQHKSDITITDNIPQGSIFNIIFKKTNG